MLSNSGDDMLDLKKAEQAIKYVSKIISIYIGWQIQHLILYVSETVYGMELR